MSGVLEKITETLPSREYLERIAYNTLKEYNIQLLNFFENLGDRYTKIYLLNRDFTDDNLSTNPYFALEFFLQHSFYRGRKNELSLKYLVRVIELLYDLEDNNKPIESIFEEGFFKKINELKLPKKDKVHLRSLLNYLKNLNQEHYNLYNHIKNLIKEKGLEKAKTELERIKEVGEKISSFVLRDTILVAKIEKPVEEQENIFCIFPIDTHVKKVLKKYFGLNEPKSLSELLTEYSKNTLGIARIAAGMWFAYYHAFDILIEDAIYA